MTPRHHMPSQARGFLIVLLSGSLLLAGLLVGSQAQVQTTITPDGTLGTTVTQTGTVYIIREFQPNSGGVFTGSLR